MTTDNTPGPPLRPPSTEELLGRLTRGALHELANPLLALTGTAEFALGDAEPGTKLHDRLAIVHSTGQEIAEIVRTLQAFIREGEAPVRRVSLAVAAEEAVVLLRRVLATRDVGLEAVATGSPEVVAAPGEVKRQLVGLLLAGVDAAPRESTVRIEVRAEGGEAVAEVAGAGSVRFALAEPA